MVSRCNGPCRGRCSTDVNCFVSASVSEGRPDQNMRVERRPSLVGVITCDTSDCRRVSSFQQFRLAKASQLSDTLRLMGTRNRKHVVALTCGLVLAAISGLIAATPTSTIYSFGTLSNDGKDPKGSLTYVDSNGLVFRSHDRDSWREQPQWNGQLRCHFSVQIPAITIQGRLTKLITGSPAAPTPTPLMARIPVTTR